MKKNTSRKKATTPQLTYPVPGNDMELVSAMFDYKGAQVRERHLRNKIAAEKAAVDARYATQIADAMDIQQSIFQSLQIWAQGRPDHFKPAKHIKTLHGLLGFRTPPPSVQPLNTKWTWKRILETICDVYLWKKAYTREQPVIDKEAILKDRDVLDANGWAAMGIKIVQDEEFYIDTQLDKQPSRKTETTTEESEAA